MCASVPTLCSGSSATTTLFEGHQLALDYLVRNLLKLYVDIEFTGSHTQVCVFQGYFGSINILLLFSCGKFLDNMLGTYLNCSQVSFLPDDCLDSKLEHEHGEDRVSCPGGPVH